MQFDNIANDEHEDELDFGFDINEDDQEDYREIISNLTMLLLIPTCLTL